MPRKFDQDAKDRVVRLVEDRILLDENDLGTVLSGGQGAAGARIAAADDEHLGHSRREGCGPERPRRRRHGCGRFARA